MRLFIALDFEELKDYIKELQNKLDQSIAKLSIAKGCHLTLKFLGEVPENKLDSIKTALKTIKYEPLTLTLDKIGFFPSENYIRVVWIGLKETEKIIELQKQIDSELEKLDFKKDKRFHPHITLARVKFIQDKENFVKNLKELRPDEKTITINNFKLIKSTLTPQGPVYETLGEFPQPL